MFGFGRILFLIFFDLSESICLIAPIAIMTVAAVVVIESFLCVFVFCVFLFFFVCLFFFSKICMTFSLLFISIFKEEEALEPEEIAVELISPIDLLLPLSEETTNSSIAVSKNLPLLLPPEALKHLSGSSEDSTTLFLTLSATPTGFPIFCRTTSRFFVPDVRHFFGVHPTKTSLLESEKINFLHRLRKSMQWDLRPFNRKLRVQLVSIWLRLHETQSRHHGRYKRRSRGRICYLSCSDHCYCNIQEDIHKNYKAAHENRKQNLPKQKNE